MSNDFPNPPVPPPPPEPAPLTGPAVPRPFYRTWVDALTKPYQQTYVDIANAPNASSTQAFIWVFIAGLVQSFLTFLVSAGLQKQGLRLFGTAESTQMPTFGNSVIGLICGAPIAAILEVIGFAIFVGVVYLVSRAFNGRATFDRLAYSLASIAVPLVLVSAVLSLLAAIPFVGFCFVLISLLVGIYALVLEVIAARAVAQIDWLGAIVSVLAWPFVICLCVACVLIVGFAALAPMIGNVFSGMGPLPIPTP